MVSRLFLVYVVLELAVVVALASTIGLGWTLLLLLAAFAAGLALAGSQLKLQLNRLRSGLNAYSRSWPRTVWPSRSALARRDARPADQRRGIAAVVAPHPRHCAPATDALALRGLGRRVPLITVSGLGDYRRPPRPEYIDGEVIDVTDVDPRAVSRSRPE